MIIHINQVIVEAKMTRINDNKLKIESNKGRKKRIKKKEEEK